MIRQPKKLFTVTPNAASFVTPYSSGDVIGAVNKIANAVLDSGAVANLVSLSLMDKADTTGVAMDIFFFDSAPASSVGADNSAFGPTDADMLKCLGAVHIATTDYTASANNTIATIKNINLLLEALKPAAVTGASNRDLYCVVVTRGSITLGAASDLVLRLGIDQT